MSNESTVVRAMVFPETVAKNKTISPLVHVFSSLVYCELGTDDKGDGLGNRVEIYDPAPLCEDKDKFQSLWQHINQYGLQAQEQLKSIIISTLQTTKMESKQDVLSSLKSNKSPSLSQDDETKLLLWQARLFLKLAEKFDQQQEELYSALAEIEKREQELFADLRQENPELQTVEKEIADRYRLPSFLKQRLKWWSRLFIMGDGFPAQSCFISVHKEAVDLLLGSCEESENKVMESCLSIALPKKSDQPVPEDIIEKLFSSDEHALIREIIAGNCQLDYERKTLESAWNKLITDSYGTGTNHCHLHIYRLPGVSALSAFNSTFVEADNSSWERGDGFSLAWLEL